jgi:hypothetical protein
MPVTAVLSKKFYEKFGEDVTNELVNWFNSVDATYRAELRELNELNFARFDAKLEQRLVALRADLDTKWTERWTALDAKLERQKAELIKWMFAFWAPTALGVLGTGIGVVSLLLR